ncbi:MAG: hypothetical protein K9L59_18155 [Desulfobacterales bacterium]|nr:hypothetical protein [Desulfobacterales bacterium]
MIRANIAELKNRLSYYLRLVKGGEVVEVIDRKTPLARIVKVGMQSPEEDRAAWVHEMCVLGLVTPPGQSLPASKLTDSSAVVQTEPGALAALLDERAAGR